MGYIIVIEGTDGCGKKTQTDLLYKRLKERGLNVRTQSFPNYDSPSTGPVKMYLGGDFGGDNSMDAYQASALYAVDRLCTYVKDLKDFYEQGGVIVMDRYVQSNMLHQAGKIQNREDVDKFLEWLDGLEFGYFKLPRPDKVLFLDVPLEVSRRMMEERGLHKSGTTKDVHEHNPEHLRHAYESGKYCAEKFGWDVIPCSYNGNIKSIEDISNIIWEKVSQELK